MHISLVCERMLHVMLVGMAAGLASLAHAAPLAEVPAAPTPLSHVSALAQPSPRFDILDLPGLALAFAAPPAAPRANIASDLPDAPLPNLFELPASATGSVFSTSIGADLPAAVQPPPKLTTRELDLACQSGELHGKPCRFAWGPVLWQALEGVALQNGGNIGLDDETRHDLRYNPYWSTWIKCVHQFRYKQWRDDDDFTVDYIGHGMQGGIGSALFEQNDPMGRGLVYANNGVYWRSRLKGMFFTTIYEVQWKIGPAGEASIGNSGLNTYYTPDVKGRTTNETGFQDFVDTPIVGFWWNVGEDALDRFLMPKIWSRTHNRVILSALFWLTPCKSAANVMAYKPLYYRDFAITPLRQK
jgi:hypothetical protein